MLRNTLHRWGSLSKTFHWVMLLLILATVPAGFLMSHTYGLSLRDKPEGLALHTLMGQIHHTLGLTLLVLIALRLAWRSSGITPVSEPIGGPVSIASRTVHFALYAVLIVLPLTGWAALSVYGEAPIWLFDRSDLVPPLLNKVPLKDPHGYGFYAQLHIKALWVGAGLLAVHTMAALWHHFGRHDDVLRRMWPLAEPVARDRAP